MGEQPTTDRNLNLKVMATIKEAYVSIDIAQLLRDKGFDNPIDTAYLCCEGEPWDGRFMRFSDEIKQGEWYDAEDTVRYGHLILCPTQQMVMAWLTVTKGIVIEIRVRHNTGLNGLPLFEYQYCIYNGMNKHLDKAHFFEKKEVCIDEAIRYCLENLV